MYEFEKDCVVLDEIKLAVCSIAIIGAITSNALQAYAIVNNKSYLSKFYRLLINITFSDFFFGLLIDPLFVVYSLKKISRPEEKYKALTTSTHIFMFFFGTSSILHMALLNIDRYILLKYPHKYQTITSKKFYLIILCVWLTALVISLQIATIGFSKLALLFSMGSVSTTMIIMGLTLVTFWRNFTITINHKQKLENKNSRDTDEANSRETPDAIVIESNDIRKPSDTPSISTLPGQPMPSYDSIRLPTNTKTTARSISFDNKDKRSFLGRDIYERRILRTLLIVSFIFIISYLPTIIASTYLQVCNKILQCDLFTLYLLQVIIELTMILGAIFRPLVFIFRLSNIKFTLKRSFRLQKSRKQIYKYG